MKRELEIVVLSDVHLGTYGCHAKELLEYLGSIKVGTLILNGDFVDMWQFRKSYFPQNHIRVIQRILRMASKGTMVYYITGNHDDALRRYADFSAGNLHLRDKLVLQVHGKSCWFFHGDVFDAVISYSPWLAKIAGKSYDYLILINRLINIVRQYLGHSRMSMAHQVKHQIKKAISYIQDFEDIAIKHAMDQGFDVVVCGHIHRPQYRVITGDDGKSVTYLNAGDWIENLTALEYRSGEWSIYTYNEADYAEGSHAQEAESSAEDTSALEILHRVAVSGNA